MRRWVSEWTSTIAPQLALGFRHRGEASYRIVQLTPPGSECSIQIGKGLTHMKPGALQGIYLISSDIEATRAELVDHGVDVSEPFHFGPEGQTPVSIPSGGLQQFPLVQRPGRQRLADPGSEAARSRTR